MGDLDRAFSSMRPRHVDFRRNALDAHGVRAAYARWAGIYDLVFGGVSAPGRRRAAELVNRLPGSDVLEVGVGTGLALPYYSSGKRVTGIDLSPPMLARAAQRVHRHGLSHVVRLLELDAEQTGLPDDSFDIAVGMFVATVVPDARRLLAEMKRVVRPGGKLLFVNHFRAPGGVRRRIEDAMAPASRALGWHPDFAAEDLFGPADRARSRREAVPPLGLFTLVELTNPRS